MIRSQLGIKLVLNVFGPTDGSLNRNSDTLVWQVTMNVVTCELAEYRCLSKKLKQNHFYLVIDYSLITVVHVGSVF